MNEIYKQAVVASFKMVSRYAGEGAYYNYDKLSYYNGVTLPPPPTAISYCEVLRECMEPDKRQMTLPS